MNPKSVLAICCGIVLTGAATVGSEEEDPFSGAPRPASPEEAALRAWFVRVGQRSKGIGYSSKEDGSPAICVSGDDKPDLAVLRTAPVRHIEIMGSMDLLASGKVMKLGPLAGLPLESLMIWKVPLHGLCIKSAALTDLSPLRGLPLAALYLNGDNLSDLSPLRDTKLKDLSLGCPKLTDLSALRNLPLEYLDLRRSGVTDLSPLEGMSLEHIQFDPRRITKGLESLRAMESLKHINHCDAEYFWKEYDGKESSEDDSPFKSPSSK